MKVTIVLMDKKNGGVRGELIFTPPQKTTAKATPALRAAALCLETLVDKCSAKFSRRDAVTARKEAA